MNTSKRDLLAATLTLLGAGCASVPMATPQQDQEAKQFKVSPDRANVYVYRNESIGAAVKFDLLVDAIPLGTTAAKTFFVVPLAPGTHTLTSKAENTIDLPVQVEAGKNYFFWQEVKLGLLMARTSLNPVDEATGRAGVLECKLAQSASQALEAKPGCTQASDCKGSRACVEGTCVEPKPAGVPSS